MSRLVDRHRRLTAPQRDFLEHARDSVGREGDYGPWVGAVAVGAQQRTARRLVALGFLEVAAHGVNAHRGIDGGEDHPIYAPTSEGLVLLGQLARQTGAAK